MFKKFFSLNNPMGLIVSSVALILTVSPEARRGTRKLLVKGAGAALALGDQMKGLTLGVQKQLGAFMEDAKAERETMEIPELSEMVHQGSEMVRHGMEETVTKTKQAVETANHAVGNFFEEMVPHSKDEAFRTHHPVKNPNDDFGVGLFEDLAPAASVFDEQQLTAHNVLNDHSVKMKLHDIDQTF